MKFTGKPVSLAAAQLLGVPFWYNSDHPYYIYKFVHTATGPVLVKMCIEPSILLIVGEGWRPTDLLQKLVVAQEPLFLVELGDARQLRRDRRRLRARALLGTSAVPLIIMGLSLMVGVVLGNAIKWAVG